LKIIFLHKKVRQYTHLGYLSFILTVTFLTFFAVTSFGFLNWDDVVQVVNNQDIQSLSVEHLKNMFSGFYVGMYQPLTTLSYATDNAIYGGINSWGFHFTSLLLHLTNVGLLFFLLRKLGFKDINIALITLIFALHPMQVEAVAWISARSTLLFTLFYITALLFYSEYAEKRNSVAVIFSFVFFILSLLSKPSAASFFLFIPLIEYWFFPRLTFRTLFRMFIFAVPSVVLLLVTLYSRSDAGVFHAVTGNDFSVFQNIIFALWSVIVYVIHILLPLKQNIFMGYPSFHVFMLIVPVFIFVIWVVLFTRLKQYRKIMLLSTGLFLIPLSVHLKIIPFGDQFVADRYAYFSVAGIAIIPVMLMFFMIQKLNKRLAVGLAILLFSFFSIVLVRQTLSFRSAWKDSISLWTNIIQNNPDFYLGYYNRGCALRDKGMLNESISDFTQVILLYPEYADAYLARGAVFSKLNNFKRSIDDYTLALKVNPELTEALYNRGNAFYNTGQFEFAVKDYKKFLNSDPYHEGASFSLILCMIQLDYHYSELIDALNEFTMKFPSNKDGFYFRGLLLLETDHHAGCDDLHTAASLGSEEAKMAAMKFCI